MRPVPLGPVQAGITRLRTKGGASPQSLYDLQNAYVAADRSILPRPGTAVAVRLPAGTKGLCYYKSKFHVFATVPIAMVDPNYVCHVVIHPVDNTRTLKQIHFAEPFLGYLYVAAEFDNGDVYHYWLQSATAWAANTIFQYGQSIVPTVINGYVYSPSNLNTAAVWKAATDHAINDVVQASKYKAFTFKITATTGTPVMTSDTEPTWPTVDGGTVVERRYVTSTSAVTPPPTTPPTTPAPPPQSPGGGIPNRYGDREQL